MTNFHKIRCITLPDEQQISYVWWSLREITQQYRRFYPDSHLILVMHVCGLLMILFFLASFLVHRLQVIQPKLQGGRSLLCSSAALRDLLSHSAGKDKVYLAGDGRTPRSSGGARILRYAASGSLPISRGYRTLGVPLDQPFLHGIEEM